MTLTTRTGSRLFLAAVLFLTVSTVARANFVFTVRGSADQEVFQGADGFVRFTVIGDVGNVGYVIDSLTPYFEYAGSIDPMDEITKIAKIGGTCGIGTIVTGATSCSFKVGFVTDDPRRPLDPDTDYGLWDIGLDVTGHQLTDGTNLGTGNGVSLVAVLDPGAVYLPEPGTFGLATLAMVCLIVGSRRRLVCWGTRFRLPFSFVFPIPFSRRFRNAK
jgi:hypothetical protein